MYDQKIESSKIKMKDILTVDKVISAIWNSGIDKIKPKLLAVLNAEIIDVTADHIDIRFKK